MSLNNNPSTIDVVNEREYRLEADARCMLYWPRRETPTNIFMEQFFRTYRSLNFYLSELMKYEPPTSGRAALVSELQ